VNKPEVEQALKVALDKFFSQDAHLLAVNASERSMSHRIAVYIAEQIPGYDVDCEYNRDGINPKELNLHVEQVSSAEDEAVTVFPDIIVHRRGNNNDNLLVVEMKKLGAWHGVEHDEQKLHAFRSQLHYTFAVHLTVGLKDDGERVRVVKWFEG
jgi:hypothetical protein